MISVELKNPGEISRSLAETIKNDNKAILDQLPAILNKEFKPNKWFNRITGELEDTTKAVTEGHEVKIYSNPIGAAFDVGGDPELGWKSVTAYVKFRAERGYYSDYMRRRRAGILEGNKFKNKKRVPFLLKATYKIDKFISMILANESRGEAA